MLLRRRKIWIFISLKTQQRLILLIEMNNWNGGNDLLQCCWKASIIFNHNDRIENHWPGEVMGRELKLVLWAAFPVQMSSIPLMILKLLNLELLWWFLHRHPYKHEFNLMPYNLIKLLQTFINKSKLTWLCCLNINKHPSSHPSSQPSIFYHSSRVRPRGQQPKQEA